MTVPSPKQPEKRITPAELLQAQMIMREQRRIEWAGRRERGRERAHQINQMRLEFEDPAWYYVTKRLNADRTNGYKIEEPWCYEARKKIHLARFYELQDKARSAGAVVYYARVSKFIKIGTTKDIDARMGHYPPDSKLLVTEPGWYLLEEERHEQFKNALEAGREWFRPTPELKQHIKNLQRNIVEELRAARQAG